MGVNEKVKRIGRAIEKKWGSKDFKLQVIS